MGAGIIRACSTKPISKKTRERFGGAWNQRFAKKVPVWLGV